MKSRPCASHGSGRAELGGSGRAAAVPALGMGGLGMWLLDRIRGLIPKQCSSDSGCAASLVLCHDFIRVRMCVSECVGGFGHKLQWGLKTKGPLLHVSVTLHYSLIESIIKGSKVQI